MEKPDKPTGRLRAVLLVILALTIYFTSGVILGWVLSLAEVKVLISGVNPR